MSKSTSGSKSSTIPAITNVGGGGSTEVGGGLTVTTIPSTIPGQPPTTVITIEENPVLSGVLSAGGLFLSALETVGGYLSNIFQPLLAPGQQNGIRVGRNSSSAFQSTELAYYHNSDTPAATTNFAGLGLWGGAKVKVDGDGNLIVPGLLQVAGPVVKTVNWAAYTCETTPAPNNTWVYIGAWVALGTPTGAQLTLNSGSQIYFTNNLGRSVYATISFSGGKDANAFGSTRFRINTEIGGTATTWSRVGGDALNGFSMTATVGIPALGNLFIEGIQDQGSGANFTLNSLQIVIH